MNKTALCLQLWTLDILYIQIKESNMDIPYETKPFSCQALSDNLFLLQHPRHVFHNPNFVFPLYLIIKQEWVLLSEINGSKIR